jgi:hypothetical protein
MDLQILVNTNISQSMLILVNTNISQSMLKLPTHSGFHDLFLNYCISLISLFSLIGGFDSVIMHFRFKLGMSKTTLKQTANIQ